MPTLSRRTVFAGTAAAAALTALPAHAAEAAIVTARVYGRVYLATNGRGIQYGEPA